MITLATVSDGDLAPTKPSAKLFTIFYVINATSMLVALLDRLREVRHAGLNKVARILRALNLSRALSAPRPGCPRADGSGRRTQIPAPERRIRFV